MLLAGVTLQHKSSRPTICKSRSSRPSTSYTKYFHIFQLSIKMFSKMENYTSNEPKTTVTNYNSRLFNSKTSFEANVGCRLLATLVHTDRQEDVTYRRQRSFMPGCKS